MAGVFNDKEMKLIPNPACLHFFKSKSPDPDLTTNLFVYQHMKTNKFLLARWIGMNVFLPIVDLGLEPTLDDDIVASYFVYCHPQAAASIEEKLKQAKDYQNKNREELEDDKRTMRAKILRDEFNIKVPDEDGTCYLPPGLVGSEHTCG